MTTDEQQSFLRWLKGIPYEIAFWKSYYSHPKSLEALYSWSDYGKKCALDNFDIQKFLSQSGSRPVMVDVGCALSYVLGTEFDTPATELHLIDPLARFYNGILDSTRNDRQRLREGMIELLSTLYEPGSVDVVHVRNALDHCANPMLGIYESLQVLRKGGVLYLHHHINEAEREAYNGFHQYNIECRDGKLVIWNRKDSIDVNQELAGIADVSCSVYADQYVVAVITKINEVPNESYDPREASKRATEMMNLAVAALSTPGFVFKFHTQRLPAGVAHPVMRRIPRKLVERLKSLVRKIKK